MGTAGVLDFIVCDDRATLIWLAQLAALELHPSLSLAADPETPTVIAFDLDPGAPATIVECSRVGLRVRELFANLGLESFAKTSGSKGLQVYVPLNTAVTYEQTKPFARAVAQALERAEPELVVSRMTKELRKGKVLVDWSQNDRARRPWPSTRCAAGSGRGRPRPCAGRRSRRSPTAAIPSRCASRPPRCWSESTSHGDLFAPVLELEQELPEKLS